MPIVLLLIILILLNSFFAASEISFISTNESKIELDVKKGNKKALKVKKIKENPTTFLSVIQIMIHIITFFQGNVVTSGFLNKGDSLQLGIITVSPKIQYALMKILIIIISIIFGELIPKRLAMHSPAKIAYFFATPISFIAWIITPLVWVLTQISNLFLMIFGINPNKNNVQLSEDELRLILASSYRKGVIDKNENKMIQNIFEFDHTIISEVMRHRTEVIALNVKVNKDKMLEIIKIEKYTRFPIYENNIDNIIGVLHVKDVFKYLMFSNKSQIFNIKNFIQKPYFVPESKNTSELFREMQLMKIHMAIVIDEYGGTAGIVTFEDLIEEILGEISDEYDKDEEMMIKEISSNEYIANGFSNLEEIGEVIKIDFNTENYDTLSGFLIGQLGRFPKKDEKIKINYKGYQFETLQYKDKVISKIKISKNNLLPKIEITN
ncbi:HlyC/CorC family transporter ['Fragaria x ananassa' phyllody phytoplasma]|uniref:HlyC/CorC family transporter n=1 Tax='Fragaria x ananassa' phyllody phytoplasma TaxID=2358428 RepID=A0ABS5K3U3_9MOLU|nr:hemolysin family protein ['Fragaria x ananassa' phyllody phytoplasma]MBS2126399.1 HlyC/CorC family transporter ['Fragaria x ananassa' phyllody phytoplasma]